ncbi:hypothetical protein HZA97_02465 [Candidatus Woesearchaeota archaeon]|nr:hypothetical protein [Candidatus Woesearchaeota archaeon]
MKKIKFVREDAGLKKRIKHQWRKARGIQSKVREEGKGHGRRVKIGFGTSKEGRKEVKLIKNLKDLETAKGEVTLSGKLGMRKKVELIKKAQEKKIKITNIKNIEEYLKNVEEKRKEVKDKKNQEKKKKETVKEQKKEAKPEKKEELTKEEEKKELDKLLTKK